MDTQHPISAHAYVLELGPFTEGKAGRLQGRVGAALLSVSAWDL